MNRATASGRSCGDRIRDLLEDADGPDPLPLYAPESAQMEICARHLPLERKLERLGAAMAFLGDAVEEVKQSVRALHKSNGVQDVNIAVLKARAALYGGIAAAVVAPLVLLAVELFVRRVLKW